MDPVVLSNALATYGMWLGGVDTRRAVLWGERLAMNGEEISRFRDSPYVSGPAYVPQPVVPKAPAMQVINSQQRMSWPDAAASLHKARAMKHMCMFTQLADSLPSPADGYLRGAPFAVKDLIGVGGMQRTAGSASETTALFPRDSASVAAIKKHGGVVIGMANLHELAFGGTSANPVFGTVLNPAAPLCIPGGSSGGSAAAVAAGVVPFALGTDTGGSIRIPASCCGVVGFKPSFEAVSREGVIEVGESLDHVGPIGRTVLDCAYAFAALTDLPECPGLQDRSMQGLNVARLGGHFEQPLDVDVRLALDAASSRMRLDGAKVEMAMVEDAELASAIYFVTVLSESGCEHAERVRLHAAKLGADVRVRMEIASFIPGTWYLKAQRMRRQLAHRIDALFASADVLLCATMRAPAPRLGASGIEIDGKRYSLHAAVSDLTLPFSLTGLPAISIPWGTSRDGVPIGLQLVAAKGQDWKVLEVAHRLEGLRFL